MIEPGVSGYSDLAQDAEGSIYCVYENGDADGPRDTRQVRECGSFQGRLDPGIHAVNLDRLSVAAPADAIGTGSS